MFDNQIILCGPYLGDFKTEIMDFYPFCRWVYEVVKPHKMFVSSHINRVFLYNGWATNIPIFEDLSRDEINQNGLLHNSIMQKDMNIIIKKIKNDISKCVDNMKDLVFIQTPYSKNNTLFPIYKKIFKPVDIVKKDLGYILFIPYINEKYEVNKYMFDFLCNEYGRDNIIVAGDMKIHFHEENAMIHNITYFKDVYKHMFELITNAKVVITPFSHWTYISVLQDTPVVSWGVTQSFINNVNNKNVLLHESIPIEKTVNIIKDFIK
jgi:hypothetical protein